MSAVSAHISTFIHATEDPDRVARAVDYVCPRNLFEVRPQHRRLKGHYGNKISTLTLHISGPSADEFFQRLWSMLTSSNRATILGDLDRRLDKNGRLHLRLDKQETLRGVLMLQDQDPIKIELTFRTKEDQFNELHERIRHLREIMPDSAKLTAGASEPKRDDITHSAGFVRGG